MTTLDAARPMNAPRIGGLFTTAINAIFAWNDMRVTRNALSKLTDRELDDIGLCRGDLEDIAR